MGSLVLALVCEQVQARTGRYASYSSKNPGQTRRHVIYGLLKAPNFLLKVIYKNIYSAAFALDGGWKGPLVQGFLPARNHLIMRVSLMDFDGR